MTDLSIKLRWPGQGIVLSDNITPVSLSHKKRLGRNSSSTPELDNLVIEGDNAPVMKSLSFGKFKLRGKIDFMLWDPPYNTGSNGFAYEDNFYLTKNEIQRLQESAPSLLPGFVSEADSSKHSKWLSWMEVRLDLAKKMMKPSGVIAVHIGFQELFRLGLLMDGIFGEENRLGIINWQCTGSTKNAKKGIASSTDYILVYSKNKDLVFVNDLPRPKKLENSFSNQDGDSRKWKQGDLSTSQGNGIGYTFLIENPLTGEKHAPPAGRHWCRNADFIIDELNKWGVSYEKVNGNCVVSPNQDRSIAFSIHEKGPKPVIYFSKKDGSGQPLIKRYRDELRKEGLTPQTFWPFDEISDETDDDCSSIQPASIALSVEQSGANRGGKKTIKDILGGDEIFDTVKPLKLTKRLISLFCPEDGVVLDAFAGSGTTGHATLSLNQEDGGMRRFILIEKGGNSSYTDRITAERIRRVMSGAWATRTADSFALGGRLSYYKAGGVINKKKILESRRDELADAIMTAHFGSIPSEQESGFIIGHTSKKQAIALVWEPKKAEPDGILTIDRYRSIVEQADNLGLIGRPIYIYGAVNEGPNGSPNYDFKQIPDEILIALGIQNLGD